MGVFSGDRVKVGIEYCGDKLATYADGKTPIGPERIEGIAYHAKARDITWGSLEALPGMRVYNWRPLDELILAWADARIDIDCIVVRCQHLLATRYPLAPLQSSAPKSERMWQAWGQFTGALAAHLLDFSPVHVAIEIESEADWSFRGSVEEYLRLLSIAYDSIKAADWNAPVVLAGINVAGWLSDDPTDDEIGERVMALPEDDRARVTRALGFYERTLREGKYDAAGFHSLHQVAAIAPTVKRMRALMPAGRAVWADDAFPAPSLVFDSYGFGAPSDRKVMEARINALDRGDSVALAELYTEQVETTHARLIEMADADVERCYFGPIRDWPRATGQPWQGLLDASGTPRPVCDVIRAAQ